MLAAAPYEKIIYRLALACGGLAPAKRLAIVPYVYLDVRLPHTECQTPVLAAIQLCASASKPLGLYSDSVSGGFTLVFSLGRYQTTCASRSNSSSAKRTYPIRREAGFPIGGNNLQFSSRDHFGKSVNNQHFAGLALFTCSNFESHLGLFYSILLPSDSNLGILSPTTHAFKTEAEE